VTSPNYIGIIRQEQLFESLRSVGLKSTYVLISCVFHRLSLFIMYFICTAARLS